MEVILRIMMMRSSTIIATLLLLACTTQLLNATEIELHKESRAERTIVRLGDVATVSGEDARQVARLQAVELFPAPAALGWYELDRRDLLELLEVRGFDPLAVSLSGAKQAIIHGRDRNVPQAEAAPSTAPMVAPAATVITPRRIVAQPIAHRTTSIKPVDPNVMAMGKSRFTRALIDYLQRNTGGNYAWTALPHLNAADAELLASGGLEVAGGREPWVGRQSFMVRVHRADGIVQRTIVADVSLPERVIAASRALKVGDRITAADLQLIIPTAALANRKTLAADAEIVGLEVTRSIAAGQALEAEMVRRPIVVKRNAVALLNVRAGGVVVGTKVRAMDDGAIGDSIRVQSLFDRTDFVATVVGPQQVEMMAGSGG